MTPQGARNFILRNTDIVAPQHVPEIRLRLASDAHSLWLRSEAELDEIGLPPPFWAFAWAGGLALARYLLDHPEAVAGLDVVDFAAGSGLVAIAAAKAGAAHVLAVDIDRLCETAMRLNRELNAVSFDIAIENRIGSAIDDAVLLAGDVFFDREMAGAIIPWFDRVAAGGTLVLVGDPGRAYLPRGHLEALAVYRVPVSLALEDAEVKRTTVWRWLAPRRRRSQCQVKAILRKVTPSNRSSPSAMSAPPITS